ncbi:hypothetical protein RFI_03594 [Reticulomyxa filosa]|uniref:Uncharacterized protein n=1 Tax=Reticulomyxa filosa TaxID=46433 RepID=X6P5M4_RETFI|nr:hypothetical protein RFI_03594 [Reticulomyxa filosa]|eukprot:ETO33506.1 hypothetical protein RFI_03594 [Reticulomyxa filosa]
MDWNITTKQALELLDKWKVPLTATTLTVAGLCCVYISIRPLKHDNIPMMDMPMHPLYGQTKNRVLNEKYGEFHEVNYRFLLSRPEPVIAKSMPMGQLMVFLHDPAVVKFVFEDQFELFEKGATIREITGDIFGHGIFASDPPGLKNCLWFIHFVVIVQSVHYYHFLIFIFF